MSILCLAAFAGCGVGDQYAHCQVACAGSTSSEVELSCGEIARRTELVLEVGEAVGVANRAQLCGALSTTPIHYVNRDWFQETGPSVELMNVPANGLGLMHKVLHRLDVSTWHHERWTPQQKEASGRFDIAVLSVPTDE